MPLHKQLNHISGVGGVSAAPNDETARALNITRNQSGLTKATTTLLKNTVRSPAGLVFKKAMLAVVLCATKVTVIRLSGGLLKPWLK